MHQLPELPYSYDALEPYIDAKTMQIHHDLHHGGYVNKLNKALENHPEYINKPLDDLLRELTSLPEDIRNLVRNNGGGHWNHSFFWPLMSANAKKDPEGDLKEVLENKFTSIDNFRNLFTEKALSVFGSGWAWLVLNENKDLEIMSTPNQDCPISYNKQPIMGIDVWEHAYYLKYQNKRQDYIQNWWNVLDWEQVEKNFADNL